MQSQRVGMMKQASTGPIQHSLKLALYSYVIRHIQDVWCNGEREPLQDTCDGGAMSTTTAARARWGTVAPKTIVARTQDTAESQHLPLRPLRRICEKTSFLLQVAKPAQTSLNANQAEGQSDDSPSRLCSHSWPG